MRRNLLAFLLIFAASVYFADAQKQPFVQINYLSAESQQAYLRLLKAEKFSVGSTGYVGARSGEESALRTLIKNKKAVNTLERV